MDNFEYAAASSSEDALDQHDAETVFYAGGTDLLPLMKQAVIHPRGLIDLKRSDLPAGITATEDGMSLGALCTLADIAGDRTLDQHYPVLAQAAAAAATPQLRNRATLGGNLLQRPRCWYYRHRDVDCWLKGGEQCPAMAASGQNQLHAIFNDSPCAAVHPSDLAPALLALDAELSVLGTGGRRQLPVEQLYSPPTDQRRRETVLEEGELIVSVALPTLSSSARSAYYKAMDRKIWAFALVSVAVINDSQHSGWRIAVGGVSSIPLRLRRLEEELASTDAGAIDLNRARKLSALAVSEAAPLSRNDYKVPLLRRLLEQALTELSG